MKKALFKFNGGKMALLCSNCRKIVKKGHEFSLEELAAAQGEGAIAPRYCEKCQPDTEPDYILVRAEDGLTLSAKDIKFIEWNEDGTFAKAHDQAAEGRSLILDPQYGRFFTWMTTQIVKITEQTANTIRFSTKNSNYLLQWKQKQSD